MMGCGNSKIRALSPSQVRAAEEKIRKQLRTEGILANIASGGISFDIPIRPNVERSLRRPIIPPIGYKRPNSAVVFSEQDEGVFPIVTTCRKTSKSEKARQDIERVAMAKIRRETVERQIKDKNERQVIEKQERARVRREEKRRLKRERLEQRRQAREEKRRKIPEWQSKDDVEMASPCESYRDSQKDV